MQMAAVHYSAKQPVEPKALAMIVAHVRGVNQACVLPHRSLRVQGRRAGQFPELRPELDLHICSESDETKKSQQVRYQ